MILGSLILDSLLIVECRLSIGQRPGCHESANKSAMQNHQSPTNRKSKIIHSPMLYLLSLCGVCFRQKRQNLLNSSRSVVFFLFFVVL
jgi:hypothetical protein